jgi:hypothetical protein
MVLPLRVAQTSRLRKFLQPLKTIGFSEPIVVKETDGARADAGLADDINVEGLR